MILSHKKKEKTVYFVASSRMKYELRKVPSASEPKTANTQREFARKIWDCGNQRLANLVAPLIIKQKPSEQRKVPRQNR